MGPRAFKAGVMRSADAETFRDSITGDGLCPAGCEALPRLFAGAVARLLVLLPPATLGGPPCRVTARLP